MGWYEEEQIKSAIRRQESEDYIQRMNEDMRQRREKAEWWEENRLANERKRLENERIYRRNEELKKEQNNSDNEQKSEFKNDGNLRFTITVPASSSKKGSIFFSLIIAVLIIIVASSVDIIGLIFNNPFLYIKENWGSILKFLGFCVICIIPLLFIFNKKARKITLFRKLTILAVVGIIGMILYFGPKKTEEYFVNIPQKISGLWKKKNIEKQTSTNAYVISDAVNVREGPSNNNEIIGKLLKDERVIILDSSGQWWKIKYENSEGYVYSDYLKYE